MSEVAELREALDDMLNAAAGIAPLLEMLAEDYKNVAIGEFAGQRASRLREAVDKSIPVLSKAWAGGWTE